MIILLNFELVFVAELLKNLSKVYYVAKCSEKEYY